MSSKRPLYYAAVAGLVSLMCAPLIANADDQAYAPVKDAVVAKECSACHIAFPAGLLPADSWTAMMSGLNDHFGENASLDAATAQRITEYLTANAARPSRKTATAGGPPPLRISELPWFKKEHDEVTPAMLKRRNAKSISDCKACHKDAERGIFEDD